MPGAMERPTDPEGWRRVLQEFERSGLSQREFARGRSFTPQLLSYWKRRLDALDSAHATPSLLPVTLTPSSAPPLEHLARKPAFELALSGGACLRIPHDFDADSLRRLLVVLREVPC